VVIRKVGNTLERLGVATAEQLAIESGCTPEEVSSAVAFWVHRGNARRCSYVSGPSCGTVCRSCPIGDEKAPASHDGDFALGGQAREWTDVRVATVFEWVARVR
jgi:hypothetical protein